LVALGKRNKLTEQLCDKDGHGDCDKVLKSKAGKIWKEITMSDIGLVYFAGLFLFLVLNTAIGDISASLLLLSIPSALSILFALFSFFYQFIYVLIQ